MSAASRATWAWPTKHSLHQRLRTSEVKRQQSGALAPPPVLENMRTFPPLQHRTCQWIEDDGPPWSRCGAPTTSGAPWCCDHARVVFAPRAPDAEVRPP